MTQTTLENLAKPTERIFLRFGGLPEGERSEVLGIFLGDSSGSRGLASGFLSGILSYEPGGPREEGVSVFEATLRDGALVVDTRGAGGWRRRETFRDYTCYPGVRNRPVYLVSGDVVGRGNTGEPLLRNCRVLEVPLTVPIVLDSWGGDEGLRRKVERWNRWRYLDGTREGHRTPPMSENFLEAYAPPAAQKILHIDNERKWRRRRRLSKVR